MPDDFTQPPAPPTPPESNGSDRPGGHDPLNIADELKDSYLTYAMSVIINRALPDVRDGLKPSQRRILVAMQDLGLGPGGSTSKCAGIVGETMKRYHPHGEQTIYPTLVRMAQEWNMRHRLIHPQGNFGSLAVLPPRHSRCRHLLAVPTEGHRHDLVGVFQASNAVIGGNVREGDESGVLLAHRGGDVHARFFH